jgi:glutamine synthetase type III
MYEHEAVIPAMEAARKVADELELKVDKKYWSMPTYADLLFYV